MIVSTNKVITTIINDEDRAGIAIVENLVKRLQENLIEGEALISPSTGEIIRENDLARLRGVLGGIALNNTWKIEKW